MKNFLRNQPFTRKLILIIMFVSSVSLLLTGATVIIYNNYYIKQNLVENMSTISRLIADRSTAALTFQDPVLAKENLSVLKIKPIVTAACILNGNGEVFAKYQTIDGRNIIFPTGIRHSGYNFTNGYLMYFEAITLEGKQIGTVFICASMKDLYSQRWSIVLLVISIIIFSSFVAFFLSSSLHLFVTRPLLKLTKTVQLVSQKNDYSLRAERSSDDEIGILVNAFNEMLNVIDKQNKDRRKLIEELKIHKENLELLVKLRTAELEHAKEHAESADRLKSAFLATMSHELRTPLNSIIGFTGILLKGLAGPLNAEQSKQLSMAKGSAQHLLELINDVLDISKIEAGELVVSLKPFDFSKSITKVLGIVKPLSDKKGLELVSAISQNLGQIISDERRVEQVFLNIINNAIKFTENGFVEVKSEMKNGSIITRITDSGIGIDKEDIDKLFRPFSQIDTGLTRNHEGTGLGLSISKKLLEKLGGTIDVESQPGLGSSFIVTLPVKGV